MGSFDETRAGADALRQHLGRSAGELQAVGQKVKAAQENFRGRLGHTNHPKVIELDARCHEAQKKLTEAIEFMNAAQEATNKFVSTLH